MIFLISNPEKKHLKLFNAENKIVFLDSLCLLKKVKDKNNTIIIDNININDEGIIEEFNYFFEEIIISISVSAIITNQLNKKILDISKFHDIPVIAL